MRKLLAAVAAVGFLAACPGPGEANAAACKDFIAKLKCGTQDYTSSYNCDAYKNTTCDISDYFECLTPKYECVNNQFDTTKLGTVSECTSKATCK